MFDLSTEVKMSDPRGVRDVNLDSDLYIGAGAGANVSANVSVNATDFPYVGTPIVNKVRSLSSSCEAISRC